MSVGTKLLEAKVAEIYRNRFPQAVLQRRQEVWRVLCGEWFSRYVPASARVLEIAPGYCEFINNIQAAERVGIDLNPDTSRRAAPGVTIYQGAAEDLADLLPAHHFDVAFMSNFLEHCRTREQILDVLKAARSVLKIGGKVLILGPNFRHCVGDYYDYFDHHLPLTDRSVAESLQLAGFEIEAIFPRTLPFTFRSHLPSWPWLVKMYLKMPWAWRFFGAQFFLVAKNPGI